MLDYLTDILLDVVSDDVDSSIYSNERVGQLNATYVQSNSALSYDIYATLRYSGQYLPVSHVNMLLQRDNVGHIWHYPDCFVVHGDLPPSHEHVSCVVYLVQCVGNTSHC